MAVSANLATTVAAVVFNALMSGNSYAAPTAVQADAKFMCAFTKMQDDPEFVDYGCGKAETGSDGHVTYQTWFKQFQTGGQSKAISYCLPKILMTELKDC